MKPMTPKRTRRLRARAAAINPHDEEFEDYGPEPNMKLSHAFIVVLLLHVIAVGGLYAFNSLKQGKHAKAGVATKTTAPVAAPQEPEQKPAARQGASESKEASAAKNLEVARTKAGSEPVKASREALKPVAESAKPAAKPVAKTAVQGSKSLFQKAAALTALGGGAAKATAQDAPAQPSAAVAEPSQVAKSYEVKAGDTITKIASSLGVTIPDLEKANGMTGNAVLQVGQVLKVPEKSAVTTSAATTAAPAASVAAADQSASGAQAASAESTPAVGVTEYTVVKGDNPWKIAKKFKISQEELMKANGNPDPKKIQIGQKLKIPASAKAAKQAK